MPEHQRYCFIFFHTSYNFPSVRASAIQVINSCHALASSGRAEVHFLFRRWNCLTTEEILQYYGLEPIPGLHLHPFYVPPWNTLGVRTIVEWHYLFRTLIRAAAIARKVRQEYRLIIMSRSLDFLSCAIRLASFIGGESLYEAHGLQAITLSVQHRLHGMNRALPEWRVRSWERKERFVLKNVDHIVSTTGSLRKLIQQRFNAKCNSILVAPNACRLPTVRENQMPSYGGNKTYPVVAYAGQLYPWKGVDILIRSMVYLPNNVRVQIIGGADLQHLERVKRLAMKKGVSDRVHFTGQVLPAQVQAYMLEADVLVVPLPSNNVESRYFTSPIKIFEYMSTGRPIVASDLPTIREVLKDGENALLVTPDDPEALAKGIRRLLGEPGLSRQLAQQALRDVREKHTWERRANIIIQALDEAF